MAIRFELEGERESGVQPQTVCSEVVACVNSNTWYLPDFHISGGFWKCWNIRLWRSHTGEYKLTFQANLIDPENYDSGRDNKWSIFTVPIKNLQVVPRVPHPEISDSPKCHATTT